VLARGRLYSYPEEEIVAAIESALSDGVRQVWLTSQDCAAYGMDRGTSLPRLLRRIGAIPGDFRIRVGMANPDFMKLFVDEFADALADPRFYRFAHIPVQSGSDRVLAEMARDYTAEDFRRICDRLRTRLPGITVATDIIAGFPTETDADFAATLDLLRDTAPPVVNRSRYSPRPGTRAARLTPLPSRTVSQRSRELLESARRINRQQLAAYVGWKGEVVVETCPKPGVAFARDPHHNPVVLHGNHMPGECVQVTVTGVEGFHLCGKMGSRGASRRTE
jgi:MiaB/RimO family radical SAM methylthiotransferase